MKLPWKRRTRPTTPTVGPEETAYAVVGRSYLRLERELSAAARAVADRFREPTPVLSAQLCTTTGRLVLSFDSMPELVLAVEDVEAARQVQAMVGIETCWAVVGVHGPWLVVAVHGGPWMYAVRGHAPLPEPTPRRQTR